MKQKIKCACGALLLLLFFVLTALPGFAQSAGNVYDTQDHFSAAELTQLSQAMEKASEQCGVGIYFGSLAFVPDEGDAVRFCDQYHIPNDAALLLYCPQQNRCELFLYGSADKRISGSASDRILSAIAQRKQTGDLVGAVQAYADATATEYLNGLRAASVQRVGISLLLGLLAGAVTVAVVCAKYRMRLRETNYPLERFAKLDLKEREDIFLHTTVTRRRLQSPAGKSGGSGGSSGSSGRSGGGRGGC